MSVNIYDVAKRAGLSVVTVSRVLNNSPKVRDYNRQKVLKAMAELDYKPNAAARNLAKGDTGMIGLVLPAVDDPFISQVLFAVERAVRERGMFLVTAFAASDEELSHANPGRMFLENRVDGILILSPIISEEYILELKKNRFPFVLLDQHHSAVQAPSVTVDNFYGGYQATASLIAGGVKRIAHISGSTIYESSVQRLEGYKQALRDYGLHIDEELIAAGNFSVESGYKAMMGWIELGKIPEAVFAADDNTAFGVMDAASKHKIAIPTELALIGYDDHPFGSMLHPALSTVRQPTAALGKQGVDLLLNVLAGKIKRAVTITLKPEVVLRETTRAINRPSCDPNYSVS